ncbi:zinc-dependent alcohol dehydrogenase [Microbacterium sp. ASV49]|uniref:Alcohol dehydrogenase catalytic domain-containing protein n=1 Tax=Microbacterium candidum TaxID=3041922 RepID=A0ABT7MWE2_9MICO|nr:alcohol dehydrogenase catalytic domain-containing protein [Microbacterium sp. ASV49]MDL9978748.1 alcohol dehydrogenase catalytic domain-containing protein [Microbacterium sp. ASV49]
MRALVITGPGRAEVQEVPAPEAVPGDVVVDVQRAGVCGTDVELYTGHMQYLHDGVTTYPVRIGHEWMGTVSAVGDGVDPSWLGARVTGDTMLGCGRCRRCLTGYQHVCAFRGELGVRDGRPGALAEQVAVPARSLHRLPGTVDDAAGALVEPGGNAFRSVEAAALAPGERLLVAGAGTIGLLAAMFARARGVEVHLLGRSARSLAFAHSLGFAQTWSDEDLPDLPWDAVIDASNSPQLPARAVQLVEPGRRVVLVGLAGSPSLVDTRDLALADVTAVGILSASPGLAGTIDAYASGAVDPSPLVAAAVGLDDVPAILAGERPEGAGPGPKFHIDTRARGGETP